MDDIRAGLSEIVDLASWHVDLDAREDDLSPEDMTAHVNGLIVQKAQQLIAEIDLRVKLAPRRRTRRGAQEDLRTAGGRVQD